MQLIHTATRCPVPNSQDVCYLLNCYTLFLEHPKASCTVLVIDASAKLYGSYKIVMHLLLTTARRSMMMYFTGFRKTVPYWFEYTNEGMT